MMYSQYLRIEDLAGGVSASPREVIRAARSMLTPVGKSRVHRIGRHKWLREALEHHHDSLVVYASVTSGRKIK